VPDGSRRRSAATAGVGFAAVAGGEADTARRAWKCAQMPNALNALAAEAAYRAEPPTATPRRTL